MLSGLSSRLFYGGQVADGVGAADRPPLFPCTHLPALVFIDVASGEEASRGESITNAVEAAAVTELVRWTLRDARAPADAGARPVAKLSAPGRLGGAASGPKRGGDSSRSSGPSGVGGRDDGDDGDRGSTAEAAVERNLGPPTVGVICLYRAQCWAVQDRLSAEVGSSVTRVCLTAEEDAASECSDAGGDGDSSGSGSSLGGNNGCGGSFSFGGSSSGRGSGQGSGSGNGPDVQISTVDAFQGEERDVIVLTACRTRKMGFAACPERLNVALTRARHHLFVVGNRRLLQTDPNWREVVRAAAAAGAVFGGAEALWAACRTGGGGGEPGARGGGGVPAATAGYRGAAGSR